VSEKGTEAGTPQKKNKAKQQGDSVRSRELLSAMAMLSGVLVLGVVTKSFVHDWRVVFEQSLTAAGVNEPDGDQRWSAALRRMIGPAMVPVGMVMAASFAAALAAGVAQGGGFSIHPNASGVKFSKLNPRPGW
jgi:flagellar biosynthetic protein FlhB